jgi:hypothetical protein
MKDTLLRGDVCMDFLELPRDVDHHTFYLSSCESGTGIDTHDSNISSRRSSILSNSSVNVDLPQQTTPVHTNIFLHVLKRLHCLTIRRKKHGRYRSLSSSLHLFFKKHHQKSADISQSKIDFYKSPSSPEVPSLGTDVETVIQSKRRNSSYQQLHLSGANKDRIFNSKTSDFSTRRSFNRRMRNSDKTVSEDNNTNTLSSVDLALTPQLLITDSSSSATPVQQITSFNLKRVSNFNMFSNMTFIT